MILLVLPWPPSANRYWRNFRGRTIVSREAKDYKQIVKNISTVFKFNPLKNRVGVSIMAYPPDRRKRDIDNLIKIVLDALQDAGYFKDDSQVDDIRIIRNELQPGGTLHIELREL